jgi:uncharacterized protein (TIGR00299 family) protein
MDDRTLYLESVAGIAGDMFSAAFLDAGLVTAQELQGVPAALGVPDVSVEITASERAGAMATHIDVVLPQGHDESGHRHYHYPKLVTQIEESSLPAGAKSFALSVFRFLAEAEGEAHGVPLEKVAFHEVGAVDSVVDVAMAGVCVERVRAPRVLASPVKLGRGTILIEHGVHPVPPPASVRLAVGMPVDPVPAAISRESVELSTPTGLAILKALDPKFVVGWPGGTLLAQGSGSGTMDLGDYPNVFRVALVEGEPSKSDGSADSTDLPYERDEVVEIRCNVDDQTGERTAWVMEKAMALGALDAWVTQIVGKKGRPAMEMVFLVEAERQHAISDFLMKKSSTFGIRFSTWHRLKLAREMEERETPQGRITYKVGRTTSGEFLKEKPEFEDMKKLWDKDPDLP